MGGGREEGEERKGREDRRRGFEEGKRIVKEGRKRRVGEEEEKG